MINKKKIIGILTILFAILLLPKIVNAADITYKTEYYSGINTAIYVNGLDKNLEDGYEYFIYITQDSTVDADTVIHEANWAHCDTLTLDEETNQFYLNVSMYNEGIFEKTGDYYAFIVKGKITNQDSYTVIDGPTKLERPKSLPNGERIVVHAFLDSGFSYSIEQYDYYTKFYGTDRKIKFHIGKIDDKEIIEKFTNNSSDAYDVLYEYGKNNTNYLYSGSFDTTTTNVTNYNLWNDFKDVKTGEYYFVYFQLDDENGKYIEVDDVQPYVCKGENFLQKLYLEKDKTPTTSKTPTPTKTPTATKTPTTKTEQKDETVSKEKLPDTGVNIWIISIIALVSVVGIITYIKCRKVKDVK